jgi:hypothetical protein
MTGAVGTSLMPTLGVAGMALAYMVGAGVALAPKAGAVGTALMPTAEFAGTALASKAGDAGAGLASITFIAGTSLAPMAGAAGAALALTAYAADTVLATMAGAAFTEGRPHTGRLLGRHAPAHVRGILVAHACSALAARGHLLDM